jgi:hypothetical protein
MNVVVLTPDRVGSTLLQRLLTVYMNMAKFDQPVINLHELTNGLQSYYHPEFNCEVLGKPQPQNWGYHQTLPEIVKLLSSVKHYKTSRLAHYHIQQRGDSTGDQAEFYRYLNDNFYIIACRRENLFEHAVSWAIAAETKKLNVFSPAEKIATYRRLYEKRIKIDTGALINYIFRYRDYLAWVQQHFNVNSYFDYEKHLPNMEGYILGLNIFRDQPAVSWQSSFDIDFSDWNRCHYLLSDMSGLGRQLPAPEQQLRLGYEHTVNNMQLQAVSQQEIINNLSAADQQFLIQQGPAYMSVKNNLDQLVQRGVMITSVPIKLQTLLEKRLMVENWDECVAVYNQYMLDPNSEIQGLGQPWQESDLDQAAVSEAQSWHTHSRLTT